MSVDADADADAGSQREWPETEAWVQQLHLPVGDNTGTIVMIMYRRRISLSANRQEVCYLSVWFYRYWFDQVGVSVYDTAATNLLWL